MEEKNFDLGYKGDWFEQAAEFAEKCNSRPIAESNYRRAIEAYEQGGFTEEALRVARIIQDEKKVGELEAKLRPK